MDLSRLVRKLFLGFGFSLVATSSHGQDMSKSASNSSHLSVPQLSPNGVYVYYKIYDQSEHAKFCVQSIDKKWSISLNGDNVKEPTFSKDDKNLFYCSNDSLNILHPGTRVIKNIGFASNFIVCDGTSWIAYQNKAGEKTTLLDIQNGTRIEYRSVSNYQFVGRYLLLTSERNDEAPNSLIKLVDLNSLKSSIIWAGDSASNIAIDPSQKLITFIGSNRSSNQQELIAYCLDHERTSNVSFNLNEKLSQNEVINQNSIFISTDKEKVFLGTVLKKEQDHSNISGVNIWSFKDAKLISQQKKELNADFNNDAILCINRITRECFYVKERGEALLSSIVDANRYALIKSVLSGTFEDYWTPYANVKYCIVDLKTGLRKNVTNIFRYGRQFTMIPKTDLIVFFDVRYRNYFSFDLNSEQVKDISSSINDELFVVDQDRGSEVASYNTYSGKVFCLENSREVLIYSHYDIWRVDVDGKKETKNITNGFGKRVGIVFRLTFEKESQVIFQDSHRSKVLISAFNLSNKENGFYLLDAEKGGDPRLLTMGPFIYHLPQSLTISSFGKEFTPIKALLSNRYVVQRMNVSQAPCYYTTTDFIKYSAIASESLTGKNQLTSELVEWQNADGKLLQGILYKPFNFDSCRKYPVIYSIYEKKSNELNKFLTVSSNATLDVLQFVYSGYMVFLPDIEYQIGSPGTSIYSSIVSSIDNLKKRIWIDSNKIGIHGHSFGGYEVNYLLTKTHSFAAASAAAGASDLVSLYNSIRPGPGISSQYYTETGQGRIGASLWESPESYIIASPIFCADKIITPLLLMHNTNDEAVPFSQGMEMYLAMRRLQKKAWLLQYDNSSHDLYGSDAKDYNLRLQQYFDHYLKDAPPPTWMTQGIPAKLKGVITGYEYDPSNNCGKDCKVCKQWNEKFKKDSAACWREISEKTKTENWIGDGSKQ